MNNSWWKRVDDNWDDLLGLINRFHPKKCGALAIEAKVTRNTTKLREILFDTYIATPWEVDSGVLEQLSQECVC